MRYETICQPGNQGFYAACRDAIRLRVGRTSITNQEMRRVLAEQGGCMGQGAPADIVSEPEIGLRLYAWESMARKFLTKR